MLGHDVDFERAGDTVPGITIRSANAGQGALDQERLLYRCRTSHLLPSGRSYPVQFGRAVRA